MSTRYSDSRYSFPSITLNQYMMKTFGFMALGLLITAVTAYLGFLSLINGSRFAWTIATSPMMTLFLAIAQFGVVIYLSARLNHMSSSTAKILFIAYAILTGVTFTYLPLLFGVGTLFLAFGFTALLFVNMVIIGKTTRVDLTKFSGIMLVGLITILIAGLVNNLLLHLPMLDQMMTYVAIALFMGLTAWDAQKIQQYYQFCLNDSEMLNKASTIMSLNLYLDFINIFLYVLRIFGSHND